MSIEDTFSKVKALNIVFTAFEVPASMSQPWLVAEFTVIVPVLVVTAGGFLTQSTLITRVDAVAHPEVPQIDLKVSTLIAPLLWVVVATVAFALLLLVKVAVTVYPIE